MTKTVSVAIFCPQKKKIKEKNMLKMEEEKTEIDVLCAP